MKRPSPQDEQTTRIIHDLITTHGGDPEAFSGEMVTQLVQTCLKLIRDGHDTGQLKLLNRALKDMRYAYRVFNRYQGTRKIAIFGSARTPEDHPDYIAARTNALASFPVADSFTADATDEIQSVTFWVSPAGVVNEDHAFDVRILGTTGGAGNCFGGALSDLGAI